MSRTLFLAFALAATCAATRLVDRESRDETIFRAGFEYIYRYESQVFSGIRTVSNQVSGLKIHSVVKVQFTRDQGVLIKMGQISIFKVNDKVERLQNIDIVPDSQLTRLTGEEERSLVEQLEKPIKFRFEEGEIHDIKSLPGDKYWSINIKKGLISLFQLKISGKSTWSVDESIPESSSYSSNLESQRNTRSRLFETFNPVASRRISTSRPETAFKVMELDVNGECETKYVINTDTSAYAEPRDVSQMVVTKVKNFDKCLSKNSYEQGLFAHLPHYQSERTLIQPSFEAEYVLTGDRHHFLIKKATVEAKYFFRPYGQDGGQMSTHISQKLHLQSTHDLQNHISAENFVAEKHGLKMEIPRSSFVPSNSVSGQEREWKNIIDSMLNKVISAVYPVLQEEANMELFMLQGVLRQIPHRQIVSIVKFYTRHGHEEFTKKREILLDILPTCVNSDTGKALLDLIKDGTVHGVRARLSIDAMVLTIKPTPEITKYLMSFYREAESLERTNPHLRQTALLGVGVLCNKMINHERRVNKPIPELTDAVEEIAQEFISLLSEARSDLEKIVVLKAMGNMGAKDLITPIKAIIEERSLSKYIRFEAVIALKKLAKPFDKVVHPILLSVILNQKENTRVRIAGIMVLKNSIPSYTTLQLLSHSIRNEPSTQVKSFIYTTLISLAKLQNPIPEIQQTMRDARKVLKTMRAVPVGVFDSKDYVADFFSERLDMGLNSNGEYIKSDKTGLPHSFFHTLHTTIFGNRLKLAKFGVEGEMITSIIRRLIGPYGLLKNILKNKASLYDIFKPDSRPEATFDYQDFFSQKNFRPSEDQEMHGLVFAELFGYEMFFRKFDKESVESYMNHAMRYVPELMNKLREGININTLKTVSIACNSIVLPTPMGIPVSLNFSTNAIFKLDGYVKATSLPSFVDFVRQRPFMTKKIEIDADLKPSWAVEVYGGMGVDMKWLRSGVAIKGNVLGKFPVKGVVIVNPADSKLTVRLEPPKEDIRAFSARVEPVTYVYYTTTENHLQPPKKDMKSIKSTETVATVKYEKNYGCQVTGMDWYLKAQWTKCAQTWCPYYPLAGKQEFLIGYRSPSTTPKEIVVQIKKFSQDMYNEQDNQGGDSTTENYQGNYRTSSRHNSEETSEDEYYHQFDHVEVDSLISTPRKVEVFVEVNLNGYRSTKTLKGKFTWIAEKNYLEHQLNAQFVAVPSADMEQFKLKVNSVWKCPLIFMHEDMTEYNSNENIAKVDLYWGRTGFDEKTIKCKLFELTESKWSEEVHTDNDQYNHHHAHADFSPRVFRYGFEAVFPQMTPVWQMYLTKVQDVFKYGLYNYLKVGIPENIPQNKLIIYAQYFSTFEKLSVVMKTPRETNYLLDMPLYSPMAQFYSPNLHDLNPSYVYRNFSNEQFDIERFDHPSYDSYHNYKQYKPSLNGECKIHSDKLMTFDGTPIMLPVYDQETSGSRCDVLFARDCSERSTFAVTGSVRNGLWSVKLNIPAHRIELVPESSGDRLRIKVNGEDFRVRHDSPVMLYQEERNPSSQLMVSIKKNGDGVLVKLHELGVTVSFEGRNKLKIKVSPVSMLQGRLCGLCGNNNYDIGDDLKTFEGKLTNSRSFVSDNVMQSEQCDVNDYKNHLNVRHAGYCMLRKTIMKEKMEDDEEKTCFSKTTVTQCRRHCSAESTSSRNVRFVCLPTESVTVERLINRYQSGNTDLTEELSSLTTSYDEMFEVPDNCVTTY